MSFSDTSPLQQSSAPSVGKVSYHAGDLVLCSSDEARSFLTFEQASAIKTLPLGVMRGAHTLTLHCACLSDSEDLRQRMRFACGMDVPVTVVPAELLEEAIVRAYLGSDQRLASYLEKLTVGRERQKGRSSTVIQHPEPQGDAAKFLTALLEFGAVRGASDLHLCPVAHGAVVKIRIDGELLSQDSKPYPQALHEQVMNRLKVLAGLDVACKRLPQDGAIAFLVGGSERSARISTLPAVQGESAVIRFLHTHITPRISTLGLGATTLAVLRKALDKTHGIILLTGPTGSGKTTTMYAAIVELERRGLNVVTVEDPVEAPLANMVQVQVNEAQGLDYPRAIRSVLRHDPDVLLIGEMRDSASARIGLEVASTGHLTLSSLHVGSALLALERLSALGIPHERSVSTVSLILTQRLIAKLCVRCKIQDPGSSTLFGCTVFSPLGCAACNNSGFSGRVVVTELLDLQTQGAKDAAIRYRSVRELLDHIPKGAFIPWTESLEHLISCGEISAEQFQNFIDLEMLEL